VVSNANFYKMKNMSTKVLILHGDVKKGASHEILNHRREGTLVIEAVRVESNRRLIFENFEIFVSSRRL